MVCLGLPSREVGASPATVWCPQQGIVTFFMQKLCWAACSLWGTRIKGGPKATDWVSPKSVSVPQPRASVRDIQMHYSGSPSFAGHSGNCTLSILPPPLGFRPLERGWHLAKLPVQELRAPVGWKLPSRIFFLGNSTPHLILVLVYFFESDF